MVDLEIEASHAKKDIIETQVKQSIEALQTRLRNDIVSGSIETKTPCERLS